MLRVRRAVVVFFFFFFQAEDGIRDVAVTGVQTCALPISISASRTLVGAGATPPLLRLISFGSRTYALRIFFQNSSSPAKSSGAACAYARVRSEASITASAPYRNSRRLTSALILINSHHSFRPPA